MNLKDILAISGEGTLFKFIAQGKNAVIVENLETGRRISAGGTAKVSALDEIAIFTTGEDMPLGKVMDKIWEKENGGEAVSHKSPDGELKKYFAEVLPDYDSDRVYTSDIRKVLHWYNILNKLKLLVREEEEKKEDEKEEPQAENSPAKPAKKPAKKSGVTAEKKVRPASGKKG
ncbi:MAG: DUF5606 domain-containing protein [Bacteroidales bacterium]|nr:DUF5606 domain-containing protein [Bacteroidales bacterium]